MIDLKFDLKKCPKEKLFESSISNHVCNLLKCLIYLLEIKSRKYEQEKTKDRKPIMIDNSKQPTYKPIPDFKLN